MSTRGLPELDARRCPRCHLPMREMQLETVTVDRCPRCRGLWFDPGELTRATGRPVPEELGTTRRRARLGTRKCPDCNERLVERDLDEGVPIRIDQCKECRGIFLDRGELDRIRAYAARGKQALRRPASAGRPRRRSGPTRPAPAEKEQTVLVIDPDSETAIFFQWITGLPLEIGAEQTLFPPVTGTLILINTAVLVAMLLLRILGGQGIEDTFFHNLALFPERIMHGRRLYILLTSMFMHANVWHLLGNMYFLYFAGDNVEERFGPWRYLAFYLAGGLVADLAHIASDPYSIIPCVGSSGAIAAVMGAYIVLFPHNRFLFRWFYFGWFRNIRFEIPAWGYLAFWFGLQLLMAYLRVPGVGWWAHIGGFVFGVVIAFAVKVHENRRAAARPALTGWTPASRRR